WGPCDARRAALHRDRPGCAGAIWLLPSRQQWHRGRGHHGTATHFAMNEAARVAAEIDASPEHVYALLADVTRMAEWSSECVGCRWLDAATQPKVGARFKGTSRNGWRRWSTTSRITVAEPGHA